MLCCAILLWSSRQQLHVVKQILPLSLCAVVRLDNKLEIGVLFCAVTQLTSVTLNNQTGIIVQKEIVAECGLSGT